MRALIAIGVVVIAVAAGGGYLVGRWQEARRFGAPETVLRAADAGSPDMQYAVATFYRYGAFGFPEDKETAAEYFLRAYKGGLLSACDELGAMLLSGELVPPSEKPEIRGDRVLNTCVEAGSADAAAMLARHHAEQGNSRDAQVFARKALDMGARRTRSLDRLAATGAP